MLVHGGNLRKVKQIWIEHSLPFVEYIFLQAGHLYSFLFSFFWPFVPCFSLIWRVKVVWYMKPFPHFEQKYFWSEVPEWWFSIWYSRFSDTPKRFSQYWHCFGFTWVFVICLLRLLRITVWPQPILIKVSAWWQIPP